MSIPSLAGAFAIFLFIALMIGIIVKERYVYEIKLSVISHVGDSIFVILNILAILMIAFVKRDGTNLRDKFSFIVFVASNVSVSVAASIFMLRKIREKSKIRNVEVNNDLTGYVLGAERKVFEAYESCREPN